MSEANGQSTPDSPASAAPTARRGLWPRLSRDFARLRRVKGRGFWMALLDALLLDSGFQALLAYRCGSALRRAGVPVLPAVCRRLAISSCGVDILPSARIGGGCIIAHGIGLVVGGEVVMGEDCTLLHGVTLGEVRFDELACPRLGDRVTVGTGAIVLGGITVGDDALIGAGAVVRDDVPAGARVAGVPARVIGHATGQASGSDQPAPTEQRPSKPSTPDVPDAGSTPTAATPLEKAPEDS